jgi:hypothetical protein
MRPELVACLLAIPLLSACASSGPPSTAARPAKAAPVPVRKPIPLPGITAKVHMMPGLEGVIGATPDDLVRQFGTPRLDVWEGDARKLQFSGEACVLDVYFYPMTQGNPPQATYVDARRSSDGKDVDRASCVSALRQR